MAIGGVATALAADALTFVILASAIVLGRIRRPVRPEVAPKEWSIRAVLRSYAPVFRANGILALLAPFGSSSEL